MTKDDATGGAGRRTDGARAASRQSRAAAWVVEGAAVCALLAACASGAPPTPPDRPLFRLPTAGAAPAGDVEPEDAWTGPPVGAYMAEFRFVRADGAAITSPRIVVLPGRRANITVSNPLSYIQDFDVEVADDAWVADPIVGTLVEGWATDLRFVEIADAPDDVALGFRVTATGIRRPVGARSLGPLVADGGKDVSVQLPRVETAEVAGARRFRLGDDVEIARVPDPGTGGEVSLRAVVRRVTTPGPRPTESEAAQPADERADPADAYCSLADSAARGDRAGRLGVFAVRLPAGAASEDADGTGVERLATLAIDSVIGPGVTLRNLLVESYVESWEKRRRGVGDPVIGTLASGLTADVLADGRIALAWRTTPVWRRFTVPNAVPGLDAQIDSPDSSRVERVVDLAPGRTVHPFFRLPDGGTAAVVVEFEPR